MDTTRKQLEGVTPHNDAGACPEATPSTDGEAGHKEPKRPPRKLPQRLTARAQEVERRLRHWQRCSQARGVRFQFPGDDRPRPFAAATQSAIAAKTGIGEGAVYGHCRALAAFGRMRVHRVSEVPELAVYIQECVRQHLLPACDGPIGNRNVYILPDDPRPADEAERPDNVARRVRRAAEGADQPSMFPDPPEPEPGKTNPAHAQGAYPAHAQGTYGSAPLVRDSQNQHQADDAVAAAEKMLLTLEVTPKVTPDAARKYANRDPALVLIVVPWWKSQRDVGVGFLITILKSPENYGFRRQADGAGGFVWCPPEEGKPTEPAAGMIGEEAHERARRMNENADRLRRQRESETVRE
jgi:hypothetical protein